VRCYILVHIQHTHPTIYGRTHVTTHTHVSMEQDSCLEVFRLLWNPKLHCRAHVHPTLDCILNPAESSPTLTPCSLEFLLRIIPSSTYCSPKWSLYCEFPIQNVNSSIHFQSPVISTILPLDFYTSIYTYINVHIQGDGLEPDVFEMASRRLLCVIGWGTGGRWPRHTMPFQ